MAQSKEVEKLIEIFKKAETTLVKEITRQQEKGLVDYHTTAQLGRVRKILQSMVSQSFKYIPKVIKEQFYLGKKLSAKLGYTNTTALTSDSIKIIKELVRQLENKVFEASVTAMQNIQNLYNTNAIGRLYNDPYRTSGIKGVIESSATGGIVSARETIVKDLQEHGITGFTDKTGKRWRLSNYAEMVARTTSRQATNMGVLDNDWDLWKMSSHYGACPICAPLQGRVYSKSGKNPNYPPLSKAYAKIDKLGGDNLSNTYMTIHPNCKHVLTKWTEEQKSEEEIAKMRQFSSFKTNPPTVDPRSKKEIEEYQKKVETERKILETRHQWERYQQRGVKVSWQTFYNHKKKNDERYKELQEEYRKKGGQDG